MQHADLVPEARILPNVEPIPSELEPAVWPSKGLLVLPGTALGHEPVSVGWAHPNARKATIAPLKDMATAALQRDVSAYAISY